MRASELIESLQKRIEKDGDLPVVYQTDNMFDDHFSEVHFFVKHTVKTECFIGDPVDVDAFVLGTER